MMTDRLEGVGTVTHELMSRIAKAHPEDVLDYYFDRPFDRAFIHASNVNAHSFFPPARLPFLIRYWLNNPIRRHVQKVKPDVFFSPDGFLPFGLKIPKVSMVHDIAFLRNPMHITPSIRRFYANWMPRYIHEADHIITVSDFSKKEIISGYNVDPDKISVVHNGVSNVYTPLSDIEKQEARNALVDGKPFFLYLGAIHPRKNILTLIRAFEEFRKDHKEDFQLVIAGRPSWYTKEIYHAIEKSKWKEDIRLPGFISSSTARSYLGSASALIYPSRYEGFGLPVIEGMACGTPVICSNVASLPEVAGQAALLFDPSDVTSLAQYMHDVTNDETLRNKLIDAGHERVKFFSWDRASNAVYKTLNEIANKKKPA
jgi:glycosyltransferase involved in cell wall biosynthesis